VALIALRVPIISVLFQRGAFGVQATYLTAQALLFYAVGLWAFSVIRVIVAAFFSLQDTKSPMKAAIVALVVNVIFSVILMFPLKHGGLALATSIASAVNVVMLYVILKRRIGTFLDQDFYRSIFKVFASSIGMWIVILLVGIFLPWRVGGPVDERLLYLTVCIATGMAAFFIFSRMMKCSEMMEVLGMIKRKITGSKIQ
jgi:putative peptidoglycan lipid II flippase